MLQLAAGRAEQGSESPPEPLRVILPKPCQVGSRSGKSGACRHRPRRPISSTARFAQTGTETKRMCFPLPIEIGNNPVILTNLEVLFLQRHKFRAPLQ
jgi:hypothetical protein